MLDVTNHAVDPVNDNEVEPLYRCDFCAADNPVFRVPARDFEMSTGQMSTGDWAACRECGTLVDRNQWSALVKRVAASWQKRNGHPMPQVAVRMLRIVYGSLRHNIIGSVRSI